MEVIGYEIKKGVFEKDGKVIEWENVHVHVLEELRGGHGKKGSFIKCKRNQLPIPLDILIGSKIKQVLYDKYQKVADIQFEY